MLPAELLEKAEMPKVVFIGFGLAALLCLLLGNAALFAWFIIRRRSKGVCLNVLFVVFEMMLSVFAKTVTSNEFLEFSFSPIFRYYFVVSAKMLKHWQCWKVLVVCLFRRVEHHKRHRFETERIFLSVCQPACRCLSITEAIWDSSVDLNVMSVTFYWKCLRIHQILN